MLFRSALSYIPMLIIFFHRLGASTENGTWVTRPGIGEIYGNINRFLNTRYNTLVLLILLFAGFFQSLKLKSIKEKAAQLNSNENLKVVFLWFSIPYLAMFFLSFKYPMFIDRYILYTSVPFFIIISALLYDLYSQDRKSVV